MPWPGSFRPWARGLFPSAFDTGDRLSVIAMVVTRGLLDSCLRQSKDFNHAVLIEPVDNLMGRITDTLLPRQT
jgi:hypothetical protein